MNDLTNMIIADKSKFLQTIFNKSTYSDIQQSIDDGDNITITKSKYDELKAIKDNYLKSISDFIISDEFMENQNKMMQEYLEYENQQKTR